MNQGALRRTLILFCSYRPTELVRRSKMNSMSKGGKCDGNWIRIWA
jgi:hypothetical protein